MPDPNDDLLRKLTHFSLGTALGDQVPLDALHRILSVAGAEPIALLTAVLGLVTPDKIAGALASVTTFTKHLAPPPSSEKPMWERLSAARGLATCLATAAWTLAHVETFTRFSERLTGFPVLDPAVARAHLGRASISNVGCDGVLAKLLDGDPLGDFEKRLDDHRALVNELIFVWYTSTWRLAPGDTALKPGAVDAALDDPRIPTQALLWPAISAHPPMVPGGYFGHWRYPPES
jgi:hypothetical protein